MKNENGFTLAEVMAAAVILMMAAQLLFSGIAVARKMERRANELSVLAERIPEKLTDDSSGLSGTLRMKIDEDTELVGCGWLYQDGSLSETDFVVNIVRMKEED